MKRWQTTGMLLLVLAIIGSMSAQASSLVDEGKENFKAHRFYAAEDCFNRALQADPQNQLLRFLLAQTLEQLYDSKAAKAAYTDCFRINPFSEQGMAAKQALVLLNGHIEERRHQANDDPKTMVKTIDTLHTESAQMQRYYVNQGRLQSAWTLEQGNREAAKQGYYTLMSNRSLRRGRGVYNYSNPNVDISGGGQIRSSWIRADAQSQALRHQAQAAQAAREIANSAANLEILLAEKKRPGEAKLRALGTDLYVRYYGTEDHDDPTPPRDPEIELKATEGKLSSLPPVKIKTISPDDSPVSLSQTLGAVLRSEHY